MRVLLIIFSWILVQGVFAQSNRDNNVSLDDEERLKLERCNLGYCQVPQILKLFNHNQEMVKLNTDQDPDYYSKHFSQQHPKYLWIGCSDSRVPAEKITGLKEGELFVHRNIANQCNPGDPNTMAVLQYAIVYLKIQNVLIVGHSNCGGIQAALTHKSFGFLENWLYQIRQLAYQHYKELPHVDKKLELNALVQLNIKQQMKKASRTDVIQRAWSMNQKVNIIGALYDLKSGLLKPIGKIIDGVEDIPSFELLYQQ